MNDRTEEERGKARQELQMNGQPGRGCLCGAVTTSDPILTNVMDGMDGMHHASCMDSGTDGMRWHAHLASHLDT